jgi:hypothetical protein
MTTQLKDFSKFIAAAGVLSLASLGMASTANAAIIQVSASAFSSPTGSISFSEKPVGTVNPVYTPGDYSGAAGAPTVFFGAIFVGQTVGVAPFPSGANPTGVVNGTPTGPLALLGNTKIVTDTFNPTSPVLSGTPTFNGPVSILFSSNVSGVGLDGGFFNAKGGTAITAFDRNGVSLGSVVNTIVGDPAIPSSGIEFLGLTTVDGTNQIAGLQFSLVGAEPSGFAIDNLRFTTGTDVPSATSVPEPFTIVGTLIGGSAAMRMRKKLKSNAKV